MARGQVVVLAVFVAILAGFGWLVLSELAKAPRRAPTRPAPAATSSPAPTPSANAPGARPSPTAPPPTGAASPRSPTGRGLALPATFVLPPLLGPDGEPVPPSRLRVEGARVVTRGPASAGGAPLRLRRTAQRVFLGAPGAQWIEVPVLPGGVVRRLPRAGAPIEVTVLEADGRPAEDVPVRWPGPAGPPLARRTDARGLVVVDDQPEGLVVVDVGGAEREGPTLRLVVGEDRAVRAVLPPPVVVEGRVLDPEGEGVEGAAVVAVGASGLASREARSGPGGAFRLSVAPFTRLAVRAAQGPRAVVVRVEPPDPTGPLVSRADLRFPVIAPDVAVRVDRREVGDAWVRLVVEPAALALVREAFSEAEVADLAATLADEGAPHLVFGARLAGPVRLRLEGDVEPEDHLLPPIGPRRDEVVLRPRARGLRLDGPPPSAPKEGVALRGRVVDVSGAALPGVTVSAAGARVVTGADGRFEVPGVPAGERVEVTFGHVDGAPGRPVDPRGLASYASGFLRAGGESGDLVLPRSAAFVFKAVRGIDGTPLAWVRVVVLDGSGTPRFDGVVSLREGRGRVEGVSPGTPGSALFVAPGLRREVALVLRGGEVVDLGEVGLLRGVRVEGTIAGERGEPLAGVTVAALDDGRADTVGARLARRREYEVRVAVTDERGAFALEGLDPARPAALACYGKGLAPAARRALVGEGDVAKVAFTMRRGTFVRLRVTDRSGAWVPGAVVELRDARTGARWLDLWSRAAWRGLVAADDEVERATTALLTEDAAAPGRHRVGPIEPGSYDLLVACPGYRPVTVRYAVPDPAPESADNPLRIPLDTMEWTVVLEPSTSERR